MKPHNAGRTALPLLLLTALSFLPMRSMGEDADPLRDRAAAAGNREAQFELGNEYFYGTPARPPNETLAAYWYKKAADAGLAESQFNYALCLDLGKGVVRDPRAALDYYKKAAGQGFDLAKFNWAMILLRGIPADRKEQKEALPPNPYQAEIMLEQLTGKDILPARLELANLFLERRETRQELDRAFTMLQTLEKRQPSGRVFRLLADCYHDGLGVEASPEKNRLYLQKAVDAGDVEAKAKLAFCYEYGINGKEDQKKAFELYRDAARAGLPMAQLKYGDAIAEGKEKGMGLDDAMKWYRASASAGCPQALFKLGVLASGGIGMEKSEAAAARFFFASAKAGYANGQYNVGCYYLQDKGPLPKDESAAAYWFTRAAKQNHAAAQRQLGLLYQEGTGVKRNLDQARTWYRKAAGNGDMTAVELLRNLPVSPW